MANKYLNSSEIRLEGDTNLFILKQINRITEYTTNKSQKDAMAELRGKTDEEKEEVLKKIINS